MSENLLKTPLYACHRELGARMVPFAGWEMPLHYGSQVEEHHRVRRDVGLFDVSHMTLVDLHGARARELLRRLLSRDVAGLSERGQGMYTCMLNETGGVIDDLVVFFDGDQGYRVILNAATRDKDLAWLDRHAAAYSVSLATRDDLAMIAVQGPRAGLAAAVVPEPFNTALDDLRPFRALWEGDWLVARSGYTGESGYELILPASQAPAAWQGLLAAGAGPCGLGARDTLRLEAGMHLYGADMDEGVSPLESGLAWTVSWEPSERDFIGRGALEAQRERGGLRRFVGLVLKEGGVLRHGQRVRVEGGEGVITSGGFSPSLGVSIALARLPAGEAAHCEVEIRGRLRPASIVAPCFVRNGKARLDLDTLG